jgi:pyruvate,water dikinase
MMTAVPLEEARDEGRFGGKCVSLGNALRAGLPTPGGYALGTETVSHIVSSGDSAFPEADAIFAELAPAMAVRSSAVGEDSDEASFAGQHATVLNVMSMQAMLAAIHTVHDSAHTPEALAYRRKMGVSTEPAIAIALQKQILSDVSGVMFTRNPITGANERYIEASWGLGEAIVSGLVVPDSFRLTDNGEVIERTAGEKDLRLEADPHGNVIELEVEGDAIEKLCVSDQQLAELHQLASQCEKTYGSGLDIEWAIAEGRVYLLQCRAITR